MQSTASWLLSLKVAPPLLLDGLSVHPLLGDECVDRALDGLGAADPGLLALLDLVPIGIGRFRATIANLGDRAALLLQGEELRHDADEFEVAMPRLLSPDGVATVEVKRAVGGGPTSGNAEVLLRRLNGFDPLPGTVGYLAMLAGELARLELFPGPVTCRRRWQWAVSSVLLLAGSRARPTQAGAAAERLIRRLAAACRAGPWRAEAPRVRRLETAGWPGLIGRAVSSGDHPVYLDLATLDGSLRVMASAPTPEPVLAAAAPLPSVVTEQRYRPVRRDT